MKILRYIPLLCLLAALSCNRTEQPIGGDAGDCSLEVNLGFLSDATKAESITTSLDSDAEKAIYDIAVYCFNDQGIREGLATLDYSAWSRKDSVYTYTDGDAGFASMLLKNSVPSDKISGVKVVFNNLVAGRKHIKVVCNYSLGAHRNEVYTGSRVVTKEVSDAENLAAAKERMDSLAMVSDTADFYALDFDLYSNATSYKDEVEVGMSIFHLTNFYGEVGKYQNCDKGFLHAGSGDVDVVKGDQILNVEVRFALCRVRLATLTVDDTKFTSAELSNYAFYAAYISNAVKTCRLDGTADYDVGEGKSGDTGNFDLPAGRAEKYYDALTTEDACSYMFPLTSVSSFVSSLPSTPCYDMIYLPCLADGMNLKAFTDGGANNLRRYFRPLYCYPNLMETDNFGYTSPYTARKSRFVIVYYDTTAKDNIGSGFGKETTVQKYYYWPVTLPRLEMGCSYDIHLTVTRHGSTDPDTMDWTAIADLSFGFNDWYINKVGDNEYTIHVTI